MLGRWTQNVTVLQGIIFGILQFPLEFERNENRRNKNSKTYYNYLLDKDMGYELTRLPMSLYSKLKRYQKDGVRYVLEHYGRCLIGDEMGVGKTLQGI